MKHILLIFLISITTQVFSKDKNIRIILPIDSATHSIAYDTIIQASGVNKDNIFALINQWIAIHYNSAKNVIQLNDKESGIIIVKGIFPTMVSGLSRGERMVTHTMTIKVKDQKMKVSIDRFGIDLGTYGTYTLEGAIMGTTYGGGGSIRSCLYPPQRMEIQYNLQAIIMTNFKSMSDALNKKDKTDW